MPQQWQMELHIQLGTLVGAVTPRSDIATHHATGRGLVPAQQLSYLRLIVSGIHEGVNLISFRLAEMFVGHGQLLLAGQKALNAKHPQPPSYG